MPLGSKGDKMKFEARPLRSVLYVPGNKEDWMR